MSKAQSCSSFGRHTKLFPDLSVYVCNLAGTNHRNPSGLTLQKANLQLSRPDIIFVFYLRQSVEQMTSPRGTVKFSFESTSARHLNQTRLQKPVYVNFWLYWLLYMLKKITHRMLLISDTSLNFRWTFDNSKQYTSFQLYIDDSNLYVFRCAGISSTYPCEL